MRFASILVLGALAVAAVQAQLPVGVGPDASAGQGAGIVKSMHWYTTSPSGCTASSGRYCTGVTPQGDSYYFTAWLPSASGLPVTGGLPVVGTINDFNLAGSPCSSGGNIAVLQLDTFSWSTPRASRVTAVNCMTSYGTNPGASGTGWSGKLDNSNISNQQGGSWKNRAPFSKGGMLYIPVERQIPAGNAAVHDATMIVSPDAGAHWCNPHTYFSRSGGPGCDSSNWKSDGDAPNCTAATWASSCTDTGYLDSAHSSMMWKALKAGTENWSFVNWGNQDGRPFPSGAGVKDGCDPNVYACFMLLSYGGQIARVPNESIMDISAWRYYTCPAMTQSYRCPGTDSASWTSNFAAATTVAYLTYSGSTFNARGGFPNPYSILYLPEFNSYVTFGQGTDISWAPSLFGPWTTVWRNQAAGIEYNFLSPIPSVGYNVVSTTPPHIQLTTSSNSYAGGQGSPYFTQWDLVAGKQFGGEAFQVVTGVQNVMGAGFQFSDGHISGSFPRRGLIWSFDMMETQSAGSTWPFFRDRASYAAVLTPCDGGNCGVTHSAHGTAVGSNYIQEISNSESSYYAHWEVAAGELNLNTPASNSWAQGNSSYSVVGVFRYDTPATPFDNWGSMWSTGTSTTDNAQSMVSLNQVAGLLRLDWGDSGHKHWYWPTSFTMTPGNWYFIVTTVRASTGCGSTCTPGAHIWVGQAGALSDVTSGQSYTGFGSGPTTKTPNISAGPFLIGISANGFAYTRSSTSYATFMTYNRTLTNTEVQFMYRSMKTKMAARGITLQ